MYDHVFCRASWYDRREDAASCAERMRQTLDGLSTGHPDLARWYQDIEAELMTTDRAGVARLIELFEEGISRGDGDHKRINGSGHSLFVHNNLQEGKDVTMHVFAGYWQVHPRVKGHNNLNITFPVRSTGRDDTFTMPVLLPALTAIVHAWDPDYVTLGSGELNSRLSDLEKERNSLGTVPPGNWMTYLSGPLAATVTPPPEAIVKELPGYGRLLLATEEPFTVHDPEHVRRAMAIHEALKPARDILKD
ncbi:MAG TPA: Imm52 family immunity protein [Aliidongia sp.]|nr:Imm52 family immunity protein [Aliidongia sp.]